MHTFFFSEEALKEKEAQEAMANTAHWREHSNSDHHVVSFLGLGL